MKILFIYGLVGRGGDVIQILALVEVFQNLGHAVKLIGSSPLQPYEFKCFRSRLRDLVRRLPWWVKDCIELALNSRTLVRAALMLRRERFDLVFHRAGIYDFVGPWLGSRYPLIVWLDAPFPVERAFRGVGYFRGLHERAMRALGRKARLIATVSQASKEYYVELGLPLEKILVVPNGILRRSYRQGLKLAERHPPFSQGPPWVIGFVGSLSRWHRVDLLLKAFQFLEERNPGMFKLCIVGMGEEYKNLRSLEQRFALEEKVEWRGPLPHEGAFAATAEFDIAVLPNTLPTGAPMKLFEYAALARPVVAPDLPNLRDLFSEEEMCFVEPGDPKSLAEAIQRLAEDPETARAVGLKAQARIKRDYILEDLLQRLLKALNLC